MKTSWIRWMGVWMTVVAASVGGCGESKSDEPTVVLVHGAWMGAWSWEPARVELDARGRRASTVELPGHGEDRRPTSELTLDAYVQHVISRLEAEDRPVILVGHSMGGVVITEVAERRPELVARLVYVAAYLPRDGESLLDWASTDGASALTEEGALEFVEEGSLVNVRADLIEEAFCGGCTEDRRELVRERFQAEPTAPLGTPVTRSEAAFGSVPRHYVRTSADRAVSAVLQDRMLEATPTPTLTIDTGHLPPLEDPAGLVDAILATP